MTGKEESIIKKLEIEHNLIGKYLADLVKTIGKLRTAQVRLAFFTEQLKK